MCEPCGGQADREVVLSLLAGWKRGETCCKNDTVDYSSSVVESFFLPATYGMETTSKIFIAFEYLQIFCILRMI